MTNKGRSMDSDNVDSSSDSTLLVFVTTSTEWKVFFGGEVTSEDSGSSCWDNGIPVSAFDGRAPGGVQQEDALFWSPVLESEVVKDDTIMYVFVVVSKLIS